MQEVYSGSASPSPSRSASVQSASSVHVSSVSSLLVFVSTQTPLWHSLKPLPQSSDISQKESGLVVSQNPTVHFSPSSQSNVPLQRRPLSVQNPTRHAAPFSPLHDPATYANR